MAPRGCRIARRAINRQPRPAASAPAAARLVSQRLVHNQWFAQGDVEVDRSGAAAECRPVRAAGERSDPSQPVRARHREIGLEKPSDSVPEQLQLVDRLAGANLAQLRRPVGGEDDQRHPRLIGLDHGGQEVRRRRPRRARDHDRPSRSFRRAEREEPGAALVDMRPAAQTAIPGEREDDRRIARPRCSAGMLHPTPDELVDQRAEEHVTVGGATHRFAGVIGRSRS